jgi:pimeloyl-ACP methyl ester carboxylesterase
MSDAQTLLVDAPDGTRLEVEQAGEGEPIFLLHGLTATRRYVVMGSRLLERSGRRMVAYDARGHGQSGPAPGPAAYDYGHLAGDLEAVLDALGIERATLAGASMGAHTIVRFALAHPERVAALALITPAFDSDTRGDYATWDALARGLREGGVEGFIAANDISGLPERWRSVALRVLRQRLSAHLHPDAVADALEAVPRSRPFESFSDLRQLAAPALVIASRDEADPGHPLAIGERYAQAIPGARLLVEAPGSSPIAWQGGQLSRALVELMEQAEAAQAAQAASGASSPSSRPPTSAA